MNVSSLGGMIGSAAGAPFSQAAGSDAERAAREVAAHERQIDANQKAEMAAGIGQTNEDQESSERDAEGRRPWETPAKKGPHDDKAALTADGQIRQSKDASGQCGQQLDLMG